jgi:hypothetical protein
MRRLLLACIIVLTLTVAILPIVGCDDIAKELGYVPAKASAPEQPTRSGPVAQANPTSGPATQKLTRAEIDGAIPDDGWSIVPSTSIVLNGDLRPRWIVSGRIKNNYHSDLNSVRVRLTAYPKDKSRHDVLDTAEFGIEDIPTGQAKAFRREVPLLVSPGTFRFAWTILSATAKPENQ